MQVLRGGLQNCFETGFHEVKGDSESSPVNSKVRQLDDEELDSGDDEGRHDREAQYGEEAEDQVVEQSTMELEFGKHGIPEPSDGEVCLSQVELLPRSSKLIPVISFTY